MRYQAVLPSVIMAVIRRPLYIAVEAGFHKTEAGMSLVVRITLLHKSAQ
jgi:hypothetical protein